VTADPNEPAALADDRRAAGLQMMDAVYGSGFSARVPREDQQPFLRDTVEHLFADIWSRPGLSIRDRRLLVIGATAALGRADLIHIQTLGALRNEELTADELREALLQLAYYVGWGNASATSNGFEAAIADHEHERSQQFDTTGDLT
jgi:4-carboxymuconolactone decarboxylase